MQRLFAGQQAAGALWSIFGGDPPDDTEGPARDGSFMPKDWDNTLTDALELGILNDETAELWRKCILEDAYQDGQQEAREYREMLRESNEGAEQGDD